MSSSYSFAKILLIDDDSKMNQNLERILNGITVSHCGMTVKPIIHCLDVNLDLVGSEVDKWKISNLTFDTLLKLCNENKYDLVIADFGYATKEAQRILWNIDKPTKEDAEDRVLTIRNLSLQFIDWLRITNKRLPKERNIFLSEQKVILHTLASKSAMEIFGSVNPRRLNETRAAFKNSDDVKIIDTRSEFFAWDDFYSIYESEDGRNFYRHLLGTHLIKVVETELLRIIINKIGKIRVRKSVLNIALFAGFVSIISLIFQFLFNQLMNLETFQPYEKYLLISITILLIFLLPLIVATKFERLSRSIINWVGPEEEFY